MMLDLRHKRLTVWKNTLFLVRDVYLLTQKLPGEEKFGLCSQVRRAAVSVVSNLAEGAARYSKRERRRFFEIARSSLVEIDAQIEIGLILQYFQTEDIKNLAKQSNVIFAQLTNLIKNT